MKVSVLIVSLFMIAEHAYAQPAFPQRGVEVIDALFDQRAFGTDDDRRALTRTFIEQLVCDFPNDGYGEKSADPNRPFSKDVIARQIGDQLWGWDWQNGTTLRRQVNAGDAAEDLTGQHFIAVPCVPHLGTSIPDPGTPDLAKELNAIVDLLAGLERKINAISDQNERIFADLVNRLNLLTAQHEAQAAQQKAIGPSSRVVQILAMLFSAASTAMSGVK